MAESLIFAESDWNIKAALSLINTLMSYRNNEILVEKLKESEIWAITEVFNSMNSERLAEFCKNTKISLETKICEAIGCIGIQTSDSSWYKRSFIMDAQTKIDEFEDHVNEQNIVIAEIKSYFRPKQCLQTKWGYYLLISIFWDFSKEARFYRNGKWIYLISKDSEPKLTENKEFKLAYLKVSEEDLNAIKADLENEVEIHLENSRQEKMISTIKEDKTYFEDPQKNIKKWTIKKISSDYSPAKANDMEIVAESLRKEMQANKELIQKNKVLQEEKQKINEELIKEKEKLGKAEDKCKGMAAILEEKELKEKDEIIQKMKNVQEESKKEQEKPPKLPEEPPKLFEEPPKPSEEPLELSEGSFGPFTIFNQRKLGLPNLINTCYFNAVLQALASNDRFVGC
ncbi:unnamed protein product [Blepharisma stoltei]|uniref:USP domain-containing protein n=1 Tax=Blepharisma stoltei TaxID=1481888 RepID=A0AAU9JQV3_9CILI|nr:unnamed protein product [Blepharisma stoltei]